MKNRSVPTDSILPHLYYENMDDALAWLIKMFGFVEHFRFALPDGQLHGVMMHHGDAWIMLKNSGPTQTSPAKNGVNTQSLSVFLDDVEEHYRHAKSSGAQIVEELFNTEYGERQYSALDLEGHLWTFSKHIRDVSPDSWGAKIADPE
ncbi:putative glyoxalase superfamily protein PhnB [Paenibacillus castaneae]|uniref:VOC family protein n=1 Tax=Paenibacillus castaneae TaxID=474957 RepID=UPI000C9A252C|nr:VOC family protein [Paenibacillus castaneae]NIK77737.1 putative glyoxalase superfamily protein PhnB [Paenibacillus castaneae]